MTAVLACFNNIGPGLDTVGPTCNYRSFSPLSKLVLIVDMLAGRLEIFPIHTLLSSSAWKRQKITMAYCAQYAMVSVSAFFVIQPLVAWMFSIWLYKIGRIQPMNHSFFAKLRVYWSYHTKGVHKYGYYNRKTNCQSS